ncbi:phosphate acetyltransferase [Corynebacterium aquatimens]|uniref:Phosphate acetyltransferase n=1 Tax=Corynebacterium aquatimens TaxID=1190508 RepID=A0A931GSU8_9CORY|nr:phosphate acetyltransferase [Corynebacterium aquatimens]MBG6122397.1 phosphate acetyltransferase [Corynebacterium aquatimens]
MSEINSGNASGSKSVLLTLANRNFDGIDLEALASSAGLRLVDLSTLSTDVAELVGADLLGEGDALIAGRGNISFDATVAASLGVPVLLLADDAARGELVSRRVTELGGVLADTVTSVDASVLESAAGVEAHQVQSPEVFENWLIGRAKADKKHIVLPEGEDDRILEAAHQLLKQDVVDLTILGDPQDIEARASKNGWDLSKAEIVDFEHSDLGDSFAEEFAEMRKKKGMTVPEAREIMKDISYFATMMVHRGMADGMVSGAAHTTAHTIKPSFQIIKTSPGSTVVSSIFLMVMRGRLWAFGDCAVNLNPTAAQLGEIAVTSAKTAAQFGIDPKVAILSYSTGTSGTGPDVDRATAAVGKAREIDPELLVDGPLQFDAACDPGVGKSKAPDSPVAGEANVYIFPDLEAGNAGYKIAQRTGNALAVGPILQGLNKPVNDLSRGATVPDIVNTVAITAIQAQGEN